MSPQPPRPNPAIYPRGLTGRGHYVHRMRRMGDQWWVSLCGRVSNDLYKVGIEGVDANPLLRLIDFDAEWAADLDLCAQCQKNAGNFA